MHQMLPDVASAGRGPKRAEEAAQRAGLAARATAAPAAQTAPPQQQRVEPARHQPAPARLAAGFRALAPRVEVGLDQRAPVAGIEVQARQRIGDLLQRAQLDHGVAPHAGAPQPAAVEVDQPHLVGIDQHVVRVEVGVVAAGVVEALQAAADVLSQRGAAASGRRAHHGKQAHVGMRSTSRSARGTPARGAGSAAATGRGAAGPRGRGGTAGRTRRTSASHGLAQPQVAIDHETCAASPPRR
ncbi:MAG: hypothetical protein U1F06_02035 [Steroidobacteraceae bacterium]